MPLRRAQETARYSAIGGASVEEANSQSRAASARE
jgi:hypothetical protein